MKTKLLLLLIGIFLSVSASAASLGRRNIKLERNELQERSLNIPFSACIDNCSLFINSSDVVTELSVAIINRVTNEVMYTETYSTFSGACIALSLFTAGEYCIQLTLDSTMYLGNFSIY